MNKQNLQLFELAQFVTIHWERAQQSVTQTLVGSRQRTMAAAEWVECILWLQLGVELEIYPAPLRDRLLQDSRGILQSVWLEEAKKLEDVFAPRILVFVQSYVSGAQIVPLDQFAARKKLVPLFRAGWNLTLQSIGNRLAADFQSILLRHTDDSWSRALLSPVSPLVIQQLLISQQVHSDYDVSSESLVVGFLRTLEWMLLWQQLFNRIRTGLDTDIGDRSAIQRRLGQMTGWRVPLHRDDTRRRFLEMSTVVAQLVTDIAESSALQVTVDIRRLSLELATFVERWLTDHPYWLGYTANA